jgi:hypothetical protein
LAVAMKLVGEPPMFVTLTWIRRSAAAAPVQFT